MNLADAFNDPVTVVDVCVVVHKTMTTLFVLLYVKLVFFLVDDSPPSEFYVPTFRNIVPSS
jgi:phage shock protein PspC (stress-responsive transcriptional regulator)